jgi:basic amino acid/polyamine antiporter, APA family
MNSTAVDRLPRVLGPWMATAIVIGTVIGSGVFKKPYAVAKDVPDFGLAMLAWVLVGVLAMLGALALAEVATLFPKAGGNYVFLREGYGRIAGFLWGWVEFWIIRTGSIAALAAVFSESVHDAIRQARDLPTGAEVISFWPRQGMTVAVILALGLVNVRGVRWGGLLQLIITAVKISTLVGVILLPFIVLGFTSKPEYPPRLSNISPAWPADWSGVSWSGFGKALVGVIWAYHGWMNIGPIAEEVKNPQRNIPLALIGGVGAIIVLYCGANLAYYLVIPRADMILLHDTPVATEFSQRLLGSYGGIVTSIAIAVSVFGALNGNILVGPRLLYAMGEDRLAPAWLSRLHPTFKTPVAATLLMAGWSCALVLLVALWLRHPIPVFQSLGQEFNLNPPAGKSGFDVITDYAMFGAIALETLAVASIFALRISRRDAVREYRCPGFPLVPAVYVVALAAVWINKLAVDTTESLVGIGFMVLGAGIYLAFLRRPG